MSAATVWQSWSVVGTAPWSANLAQDQVQRLAVGGPDLDQGVARVVAGLADGDLLDLKRAAVAENAVQDLGQDQAVDDMAANFDFFDGIQLFRARADGGRS